MRKEGNILKIKNNEAHKNLEETPRATLTTIQQGTKREITILPDSGATTNAINEATAKKLKLIITPVKPNEYRMANANNGDIQITGETIMEATLDQTKKQIHVLISPDIQEGEIILGWQDMKTFKIIPEHFPSPCRGDKTCCNR